MLSSSLGYLVHLDGSLCPLQSDGVGLLQPLGNTFLEPLVEIVQSQRSIPVDEGSSFSNCTTVAQTISPPCSHMQETDLRWRQHVATC